MTTFESLANELLIELFEYFDCVQLFRVFSALNSRFDNLLLQHFPIYHFNFQSVLKKNFQNYCQKYLSLIINQIISLRLTDENKELQQTYILYENYFLLRQFTRLKSLTLCYVRSTEILNKILSDCLCLTHLTLKDLKLRSDRNDTLLDLNNIWNLPKLIYFHLSIDSNRKVAFSSLTVTSLSLEYLILRPFSCTPSELTGLLVHTPHLRRFRIHEEYVHDRDLLSTIPPITTLQRFFLDASSSDMILLEKMPNLCHLTVEAKRTYLMNGDQWEQIIINYLPKLKIFRLKMYFKYLDNREAHANDLLDSFRSPFWIDKHQWFIRCHWDPQDESKFIFLYTIPYTFDYFPLNNAVIKYKSTCLDDDKYNSYDRVRQLYYSAPTSRDFNEFSICFPNIRHLYVQLPVNNQFWSDIPTLNKITSLNVTLRDEECESQLLDLLNHMPCLKSLKLHLMYRSKTRKFMSEYHTIKINSEEDSKLYSTTSDCYSNYKTTETMVKNHADLLDLVNSIINRTRSSTPIETIIVGIDGFAADI